MTWYLAVGTTDVFTSFDWDSFDKEDKEFFGLDSFDEMKYFLMEKKV